MEQKENNRIPRSKLELATALRDHLVILRDALEKMQNDFAFVKVIAGELRVLVHTRSRNTPLLLTLADQENEKLLVTTDGPPVLQRTLPLKDFFQGLHFASGTEKIEITKEQFIGFASQQEGTAHEDLTLDKDYLFSKGNGILIGGLPPNILALRGYGRTVYTKGVEFLQKYYPNVAQTL